MKHFFRKHRRWLMLLLTLTVITASYLRLLYRRSTQSRIAAVIVALGGRVEVRSEAPFWLFHFASDTCRHRFSDEDLGETWGPNWLRNSLLGDAITAVIKVFDVADRVQIRIVENEAPSKWPEQVLDDPSNSVKTPNYCLPALMNEISKLHKLHELHIECDTDCTIESRMLPASVQKLSVHSITSQAVYLDFRVLPNEIRMLRIASNSDPPRVRVDLGGNSTLLNLQYLGLENVELEPSSLLRINTCVNLKHLLLGKNPLSDARLEGLTRLTALEDLQAYGPELSDTALERLTDFPKLKRATLSVTQIGNGTRATLQREIIDLRINLLSESDGRLPVIQRSSLERIQLQRENGFDRSEF